MGAVRLLTASGPPDLTAWARAPLYAGFDPAAPWTLRADAHLVALRDSEPVARCSLWWTSTPGTPEEQLGLIGHYEAVDDDAAEALLDGALTTLTGQGRALAVGPMDGSTWHRYRFVTERGTEPPFFLEPDNPDAYPRQWTSAGFAPLAEYVSALETDLRATDPRLERIGARLAAAGVVVRDLRAGDLEAELRRVYDVSVVSFADAFLYTPVGFDEFASQYTAALPALRPGLVLIAEQASAPVGYAFALPDLAEAARGAHVATVVIKTVAVLPGREFAGLGVLLAERVRKAAAALGMTRAIHALMHVSNRSVNLSGHYAERTMRHYALFSRRLDR